MYQLDLYSNPLKMDSKTNKWLIRVFSPSIEEVLEPKDILSFFPEWPTASCDLIRSKSTAGERTKEFLKYMIRDDHPFTTAELTQFLDALQHAEYVPLRKLLLGENVHKFEEYLKIFRIFETEIADKITVNTVLLNALVARKAITTDEREEIMGFVERGLSRDGLYILVRCLPRRIENWPIAFMEALRESKNEMVMCVLYGSDEDDDDAFATDQIRKKNEDLMFNCNPECLRTMSDDGSGYSASIEDNISREGNNLDSSDNQQTYIKTPVSLDSSDMSDVNQQTNIKTPVSFGSSDVNKQTNIKTPVSLVPSYASKEINIETPEKVNNLSQEQPMETSPRNETAQVESGTLSLNVNVDSMAEKGSEAMDAAPAESGNTASASDAPETFKLRSYQEELAGPGIAGNNSIVCAPTGSGKTHVALAIAKSHLDRAARGGNECVLFLVDTVHLMDQQLNVFKPHLKAEYNPVGMSGGQTECQVGLGHMMGVSKCIVLTAQILLNALESDSDHNTDNVSMSDISLIIFDECQNTTKKHCYNQIMKYYLEQKLKYGDSAALPQIIGLTASLGVGHASTTNGAINHIEKVCANLDATEICVVKNNIEELRKHVATPEMELKTVPIRDKDPCKLIISQHMERIHARMKLQKELFEMPEDHKTKIFGLLKTIPTDFSSEVYTLWCANLGTTVPIVYDQRLRKPFWTYHAHLKIYHEALNINAQVRTKDAVEHMKRKMAILQTQGMKDEVDEWLEEKYKEIDSQLKPIAKDKAMENPLLQLLREKILAYSSEQTDCRGIIFVQTRAATEWLKSWMEEDHQLATLRPDTIIGTKDMTQNQQIDVVKMFRDGKNKCLIATSVAEKGLDIQQCNWVIKYIHTTNEIALVQAKGRARKLESHYGLVAPEASGKVEKEKLNLLREAMMNEAVNEVSHMDREGLRRRLIEKQKEELLRHKMEAREKKQRPLMTDGYNIHCRKCDQFVTASDDLRVYQKSHYTSIRQDFEKTYVVKEHPRPLKLVDFEKTGKIHCKQCGLDWGVLGKVVGREMPLLKPQGLLFVDVNGKRSIVSKWKNLKYAIPEMIFDELYNL